MADCTQIPPNIANLSPNFSLYKSWLIPAFSVAAGAVDWGYFAPRAVIPLLGAAGLGVIAYGLAKRSHPLPFVGAALVFLSGYFGLAVGFAPFVVPYALTFRDAASADNALGLMLAGVAILLPAKLNICSSV